MTPKSMSLQEMTKELGIIIDDIHETHRQIGLTKSEKRKSQLMRHIEKQQIKIRKLTGKERTYEGN